MCIAVTVWVYIVRRLSREQHGEEGDKEFEGCVHICSVNNFPTAAGLASSAAGYACLGEWAGALEREEISYY